MNRRQVLKGAAGVGAAAASGVSPQQALGSLPPPASGVLEWGGPSQTPEAPWASALHRALDRRSIKRSAHTAPLPPHIEGKRSWSPVFKASEAAREQIAALDFRERIWSDPEFAMSVARKMGLL